MECCQVKRKRRNFSFASAINEICKLRVVSYAFYSHITEEKKIEKDASNDEKSLLYRGSSVDVRFATRVDT